MRLAIVVAVALLVAFASARVTPNFCSSQSTCTATDCNCCDGYCVDNDDVPLRKLGETCDTTSNICNGQCANTGNCRNGRCVKTNLAMGCPCATTELGLGCGLAGVCTNHTCYGSALPGGAACTLNSECASATCANGICTPMQTVSAPAACGPSSKYYFPCTTAGQVCVNTISTYQCAAPAGDNGYCQVDNDCLSGACNVTANPRYCVARFSAPAGQYCDSHAACASHWCFDNHCADPMKRLNQGEGQPCPSGGFNCAPGLMCYGTSDPVCMKVTGYSCDSSMTSLCGGKINFSPRHGQGTSGQEIAALSGSGSAVCACGKGGFQCTPAYYSPQSCDAAYLDMMVLFKADESASPYSANSARNFEGLFAFPWSRYPAFARQAMAKYMCCALGPNGDLGIQYLMEATGDVEMIDYMLDCSLPVPDMVVLDAAIVSGTVCNPAKIPTSAQLFKGNVRYRGRAKFE